MHLIKHVINLYWKHCLFILVAIAFISISVVRRLNFDEWLVLRAGWLSFNNTPSDLHFLMPYTWVVGLLASILNDPASSIYILRVSVCLLILAMLWFALKRNSTNTSHMFIALLLCLSSGVFVSHAFEFRYDSIIVICWLWAWALLGAHKGRYTYIYLGVVCTLLVLHHTKGVFYSVGLICYLLLVRRPSKSEFIHFILGGCLIFFPWLIFLVYQNLLFEQFQIYIQFSQLGVGADRVSPFNALSERFEKDIQWWIITLPLFLLGVWKGIKTNTIRSTLWLLLMPIIFIFLHPRPWDYLVTPLIPFVSLIAAFGLSYLLSVLNANIQKLVGCSLFLLLTFEGANTYAQSFELNNLDDIRILQLLFKEKSPGDTIVDPSGAVYFVEPFDQQWYLDTLFKNSLMNGNWMKKTASELAQSTFVVSSYRVDWIMAPPLITSHERVCKWLWIKRGDPRINRIKNSCQNHESIDLENFWGI